MFQVITIDAEANLVNQLQALLKEEQVALIDYDVDHVEQIVEKKTVLLQSLAEATQKRYDHLKSNGFIANEKGMANWLSQNQMQPIQQAWKNMQETLLKCKELNRINAMLVSKFMVCNQNTLKAFQNNTNKQPVHLYGANGQSLNTYGLGANGFRGFVVG